MPDPTERSTTPQPLGVAAYNTGNTPAEFLRLAERWAPNPHDAVGMASDFASVARDEYLGTPVEAIARFAAITSTHSALAAAGFAPSLSGLRAALAELARHRAAAPARQSLDQIVGDARAILMADKSGLEMLEEAICAAIGVAIDLEASAEKDEIVGSLDLARNRTWGLLERELHRRATGEAGGAA